jgi:outer membrane protein OmpA-like peptidoglycan-associated protein
MPDSEDYEKIYFPDNKPISSIPVKDTFKIVKKDTIPPKISAPLNPIVQAPKVGDEIILENIYFTTGEATLLSASFVTLKDLVALLKEYPKMAIEISGHTDDVGTDADNQILSERRAAAVYSYLISNSVEISRLSYKGFGEMRPIADNDTPEGRRINRRVQFKILRME